MRQFGNRGRQLSVGEHLEIRHRVASGETFASAANAVGCSTKSVQRLINRMGGLKTFFDARFPDFESEFIATLASEQHRSRTRVRFVLAQK